ncbi:MAG: uracil-DNA glycosylase [Pseudomonadota bacterium]
MATLMDCDGENAHAAAAAYLAWHADNGVDLGIGHAPCDWFAEPTPSREPRSSASTRSDRAAAPSAPGSPAVTAAAPSVPAPRSSAAKRTRATPDDALAEAQAIAAAAPDLATLEAGLAAFDGCALKATAKSLCFGRGAENPALMVIGEAPGREEDIAGAPFVGPAGKLLDKMLAAIGQDGATTYVTNLVYWRPPGNRSPTPEEAMVCRPFLDRQIELLRPHVVLILGRPAANTLLETTQSIMKMRGKWAELRAGGHTCDAVASLHPAYLLRTPLAKRSAWRDLQAVQARLTGVAGDTGDAGEGNKS